MADLASTDVTVTLALRDKYIPPIPLIYTFPSLSFGDGALTYPAGGIPLPAVAKFGVKTIKRMHIQEPANGYVYRYDPDNHKLQIYYGNYDASDGPLIEFVGAPAATVVLLSIIGE